VTLLAGASVGTLGALAALPRRLAAREVKAQGGELHRGTTRRTTILVVGRTLLTRLDDREIAGRIEAARAPGRTLRSENGFLRLLAGAAPCEGLTRTALLDQSCLAAADLDLLALFDAFEHDAEPFSFRDLILARKYAGLVAGGASWAAIARSVHRSGPAVSLTAKSLQVGGRTIYARHDEGLAELDGQLLLGLGDPDDPDDIFAEAEAAEAAGEHAEAAALYGRCLASDPGDPVAAFNRANCLAAAGRLAEAEAELARALRLDPRFVEAWFNLAGLARARGGLATARRHLEQAIAVDPDYADAVFNLASVAFETGDLAAAGRWWARYLELDPDSDWGRAAARGVQFVSLQTRGCVDAKPR
jgi:tetratricopeptide (TPR) repeat protein